MSPRATALTVAVALVGCGTSRPEPPSEPAEAPAEPPRASTEGAVRLAHVRWPALPEALAPEVARCVEGYRSLGDDAFPARAEGASGADWYRGPFQGWIARYNEVREGCDRTFAGLDEAGPEAQVVLATQSVLHERMAARATPHEDYGTMFVMARYWRLGAACTYEHCADGPLDAWARFCRDRASDLPDCPAVEPDAP